MQLKKYLGRLQLMHEFISKENTGTPVQFCKKIGIKRTALNTALTFIRRSGIPLKYDRLEHTYFYVIDENEEVSFQCGFNIVKKKKIDSSN